MLPRTYYGLVRKISGNLPCKDLIKPPLLMQRFASDTIMALSNEQEQDSYKNAVKMLNQTQLRPHNHHDSKGYFQLAEKFAEVGKLTTEKLNKLAAIHVSGTKGKGSVCAFSESILRHSGYKTGFYSSPHLIEVRERIRINGRPISKQLFAQYFWECWNNYQKCDLGLPTYKMFMTFMSFHVFLKEKVDVAIVEVGLGGEYDATNILREPYVCGVTLLEKDHLVALGGTTESIAWHKAGIFKCGVPAFTIPQDPVSLKVLEQRAIERKTLLKVVPSISTFPHDKLPVLGIQGDHQLQNASLAVDLCRAWLQRKKSEVSSGYAVQSMMTSSSVMSAQKADIFEIPDTFNEGLSKAYWPGRCQCIERANLTIYIDGAHTRKSVEACASWFCGKANEEMLNKKTRVARILLFNCKGNKDAKSLLEPLVKCHFDYVVFCPNLLSVEPLKGNSDVLSFSLDPKYERQRCYEIQNTWKQLLQDYSSNSSGPPDTLVENSRVFACVTDALHWSVNDRDPSIIAPRPLSTLPDIISCADHIQILVTGSLYLSGLVMEALGPDIVEP